MGIMVCEVHGDSGFVETCAHVAEQILAGKAPHGRRFRILSEMIICDDCFAALGFDQFISLSDLPVEDVFGVDDGRFEAYEAAYERTDRRHGFCVNCVAELPPRGGESGGEG